MIVMMMIIIIMNGDQNQNSECLCYYHFAQSGILFNTFFFCSLNDIELLFGQ